MLAVLPAAARAGESLETRHSSTLFEILSFGREINIILGVMLFAAVFLVINCLLLTRRRRVMPLELIRQVQDLVSAGNIETAISAAQTKNCLFSATTLPGLRLHSHSHERICAAMEAAGRRALGGYRQKIAYLSYIGMLAPMLGLLGTVLGLTKAFNVMGADGPEVMRSTLMTGYIGEAMGTTAVGLIVGIPAMAAYFLCRLRLWRLGDDLEAVNEDIAAALTENASFRPAAAPGAPVEVAAQYDGGN